MRYSSSMGHVTVSQGAAFHGKFSVLLLERDDVSELMKEVSA